MNDKDDDCNPDTPDRYFDIVFDMPGYDTWLPNPGDPPVTINVNVVWNQVVDGSVVPVVLNVPVRFSLVSITRYPGAYTNDPSTDTGIDFSFSLNNAAKQVTVTPLDYAASVSVLGEANFNLPDGTPVYIYRNFTAPKDSDGDGLPDAWENLYGDLARDGDIDRSEDSIHVGDGLSNFDEYRGFRWGTVAETADPDYKTTALVPQPATHFRSSPNRKDLFVKYRGFTASRPFAIGTAFSDARVDVHALDAAGAPVLGERNLDVMLVTNDPVNTYQSDDDGHIDKRGIRDWKWDTKGISLRGTASEYGSPSVLQKPLDRYFADLPYRDDASIGAAGSLDVINIVEDGNDNGIRDGGEDANNNGLLDGDLWIIGTYGQTLSPFDVDRDGLVELPLAASAASIDSTYEYSMKQVSKSTITHEMGHAVGMTHNGVSTCLMYEYSNNWSRDGHFSRDAREQLLIHNGN